jgi:hypothetical protein
VEDLRSQSRELASLTVRETRNQGSVRYKARVRVQHAVYVREDPDLLCPESASEHGRREV